MDCNRAFCELSGAKFAPARAQTLIIRILSFCFFNAYSFRFSAYLVFYKIAVLTRQNESLIFVFVEHWFNIKEFRLYPFCEV
jgi:hypothetical protein